MVPTYGKKIDYALLKFQFLTTKTAAVVARVVGRLDLVGGAAGTTPATGITRPRAQTAQAPPLPLCRPWL